ncbi:MAG: DNA repair protein RecN [Candidatus Omnitrophica bacterium]|nr:DNA repair protein RecN [Candidatus Omnitrophota bacterium]
MLTQLTIENFGLIERVTVEFVEKLNILTGSTGAGKSILIDGLRFALGERLNSAQIRDANKPCLIEIVFELRDPKLRANDVIKEYLTDEDQQLIINRQYLPDGRTKIKVNGFNITVAQLKVLGNFLIDFHGAHDHQLLLAQEQHIGVLDQLTDFGSAQDVYRVEYQKYLQIKKELAGLEELSASRDRDLELVSHQVKELEQVVLTQEAYQKVCEEQSRINNAEKLYGHAAALLQILEGDDGSLADIVRRSFSPLRSLMAVDAKTSVFEEYLNNIQENSEQLLSELRDYLERLSFEPAEAAQISQKYDIYDDIKRKYGPSIEDVAAFFSDVKEKYHALLNFEENDAQLRQNLNDAQKELKKLAQKLTTARKKSAGLLKATIEKELKDLGIDHVSFEARILLDDFHASGCDQVVFYISPNAGEDLKPLAEIVSSGEAARLMLALKKALIKVDPIPVLIFDEIDAQIGGRLGTITGKKLKELSEHRQVILITHLPQIASFADSHFKVIKKVSGGRTITTVNLLDKAARVEELAEMMSGKPSADSKSQSDISLSHAQAMLSSAKKQ